MHVLLIGSSIFEQWGDASAAFPGAAVRNCAVGGTRTDFWISHITELMEQRPFDVVAYYCGSNDFNAGVSEHTIINNTITTFNKVKEARGIFIYYSIIKSPQKHGHFEAIDRVNTAVSAVIDLTDYTVDLNYCLCEEENDISGLYQADQLHLTPAAYRMMESYNIAVFWDRFTNNC